MSTQNRVGNVLTPSAVPRPEDVLPLAAQDFACYSLLCYPKFELAPHIGKLVDALEGVERGEITRLMIVLPPRHGKSVTASELFPSWYLGRHPERHVIASTYSQWIRPRCFEPCFASLCEDCRFQMISLGAASKGRFPATLSDPADAIVA